MNKYLEKIAARAEFRKAKEVLRVIKVHGPNSRQAAAMKGGLRMSKDIERKTGAVWQDHEHQDFMVSKAQSAHNRNVAMKGNKDLDFKKKMVSIRTHGPKGPLPK